MATNVKPQKDKPHGSRLTVPRPTAASAARAARNAMNRNLTMPPQQRLSPTHSRPSLPNPQITKMRSPIKNPPKNVSKSDCKVDKGPEQLEHPEISDICDTDKSLHRTESNQGKDNVPSMISESEAPEANESDTFTNDTFVINNNEDMQSHELLQKESTDLAPAPPPSRPETPGDSPHPTPSQQVSCPPTPLIGSRPSTPGNAIVRSAASRPSTPVHPMQLKSLPCSRPATPQRAGITRPKTPSSIPVASPVRTLIPTPAPVCSPVKEEDDVKTVFSAKQKQFQKMKKDLDLKQQAILEVFDSMRNLNERLVREGSGGGEGLQCQELVVFNVGDWTAEEVAQLCRDAVASTNNETALDILSSVKQIDEDTWSELGSNVSKVPSKFADLCLQAFTARQELIDWVKDLIERYEEGSGETLERISKYNSQGIELCEALKDLKSHADEAVDTVTQISRSVLRERSALLTVGESLVREIARLRQDLEARAVIVHEMREIRAENETAKNLQDTYRLLEEEKASKSAMKEKLATTESQLRQTRIRVSKMDRQLREAEASIVSLTATVKTLEDQSRQREVHLEARARKLKESLKTGEVTNTQIVQQRDSLQAEVQKLKEQTESMVALHKNTVHDLTKEVKELKMALEQITKTAERETELRISLENTNATNRTIIDDLKTRNAEHESSRDLPTEREIDLWAELQATKDTLRVTEEEVTACKREKVRFLETLTKISESENKVGMQQKLAAELLSKEEIIGKMQIQIRELTKNIKLNEQKVVQYEQYVRDLHAHNRAVANCQEAPNGVSYQDLQQEIMNLRMSLLDSVHRNEELSELISQKEQQLEQQDKTSRAQARIIKVREELINMLKNKETEQSRALTALQQDLEHRIKIVDEVNKQIAAKAEEIQELFSTLENKQQQIHRLEKIVLALEEQQRRAQAQRTRHEEKIAALEHELAAGNRRERKFLFF